MNSAGIYDEFDTVRNNDEFYERLDDIVSRLSKLYSKENHKSGLNFSRHMVELAELIREGYEKDFYMPVNCCKVPDPDEKQSGKRTGDDGTASMNAYMTYAQTNLGRIYSCYTTREKAQRCAGDDKWMEMSLQFVMNNLFNRRDAVAFSFNHGSDKNEHMIIVPLLMIRPFFPGFIPKPESFRE